MYLVAGSPSTGVIAEIYRNTMKNASPSSLFYRFRPKARTSVLDLETRWLSRTVAHWYSLTPMIPYRSLTRTHTYSLTFVLPLLLLYEAGVIYIAQFEGSSFRNGADVLLRTLLAIGGVQGTTAMTMALIVTGLILIALERRRRDVPLRFAPFMGMAAESVLYAFALGIVVGTATQWLLEGITLPMAAGGLATLSTAEGLVLSLGAGLYEELLFRVLIVGGIYAVFRGSGLSPGRAGVFSALLASLVFSGFHYIGPYGDPWTLASFLFRFLAGLAFSVLFLLRGFGIVAWTHALYDVMIVMAIR